MDFLNQFPNQTIAKDDNSLFSFTDKADQKGDLPFAFGTQSSEAGEISFLNQMKSQDNGESFALDETQKNIGGINFLKTIYEVPESSNNIFNSDGDGFPLQNPMSVPMGLDFIREGTEDSFNFGDFQNKQNSPNNGNEEGINVDINNLFKNSASPLGDNSKANSKSDKNENIKDDNILTALNTNAPNINLNNGNLNVNIQSSGKKGDNANNNMINPSDNINMNINKIPSFPNVANNQNKNISITPEARSNPTVNQRQTRPNNTSIIILNKNKFSNDNKKNNVPDMNNKMPQQFQNIAIKPQVMKDQKNNLDDIDKMISLNLPTKPENKQGNKNTINNTNLPNDLTDIFSSSSFAAKRSNLEPKDKDLQNIDNLLNFTKEPMQSYNPLLNKPKPSVINSNPIINNNNNNINNNNNSQFMKKKTQTSNTVMIKPLPGDSFDKKSQVVKLSKDELNNLSQMETANKKDDNKNKIEAPSKIEIVKRYNDLVVRLNKIREYAKEYRNLGNYFSQLISANENYEYVYPHVIRGLLEEYSKVSEVLLKFVKIKNNRMNEMNNEFDEDVKKYSLYLSDSI
jgi:hypothetical protein